MIKGIRPDITPVQLIAIVGVILGLVMRELGLITTEEFFGIVGSSGVLKLSDSGIRIGRNVAAAAQHNESAAQLAVLAVRPDGDDSLVPRSGTQVGSKIVTSPPPTAG